MKRLPDNWFLLRIHKNDFVFSNKQESYFVHIDCKSRLEDDYSIYYLQKQNDFLVIGLEKAADFSSSTTKLNALEKAYMLMDSIDEFFMKDA
jgi:hypothetical protein